MRAKQFILEYNVAKTTEHFGSKLLDAAARDISHEVVAIRKQLETDQKLTPEQEQQLISALLKLLENADPTPNKKYMVWLAKMYATGGYQSNYEDMASTVRENLAKFDKLNLKRMIAAPYNDIMRFKNIRDFLDLVEPMSDPFDDKQGANKGTAKEYYEDSEIRVIIPEDMNAACYYGQGTRWCTAAKNNNMYERYTADGNLYIMLPKQPKYDGEKYQLHFASGQFMDEGDSPISDMIALLTGRFGDDVMTFFFNKEPMIKQWVVVTPEAILQPLIDQIAELALEHIHEQLSQWEIDDDYWYRELIAQGYTDENGDLDMDKAEAAGANWLDNNYEAKIWYDKAVDAIKPSIDRLRDKAQEWADENGEECTLHQLDALVASIVIEEFMTRRGHLEDGGLSEWMGKHIAVRASTPSQQAAGDPQWKAEYFKGQQ